MPTKMLELDTEKGDIDICEDELPTITEAELIEFGISRETLHDCFVEGVRLMQSITASERVRPCAVPNLDGKWEVRLVRYIATGGISYDDWRSDQSDASAARAGTFKT